MTLLAIALFAMLLLFSFVIAFGAPYLPTLRPQIEAALDMLDLAPSEIMLEIGSGDGRVLLAAAQRGWNVVGYELNPILVLVSLWLTRKYRQQVRIVWGNAWTKPWPEAEGIYFFGLQKLMPKLHTKIVQTQSKPTKLVSFSFTVPNMKPVKRRQGVFLYVYNAKS